MPFWSNIHDVDQTNYPVTWVQAYGVQPVIGNGTLYGQWYGVGANRIRVKIALTFGSTTTPGNNGTAWQFSLPFIAEPISSVLFCVAQGVATDVSSNTHYFVNIGVNPDSSLIDIGMDGYGVRSDMPFVWTTGDKLELLFLYTPHPTYFR